ncbi:MAG: DUF3443 domain-containing protein [Gammaproteobacteria bacterium]|nr:DUF3443 domain-containing protein [Gammaproteobacteria bacterium]
MRLPARPVPNLAAALGALAVLAGCGGDLGSGGATSVAGSNVTAITVDGGPAGAINGVNSPYVSVTVCQPGSTSNCQVIDHVLLDTGSTGLRLLASVANKSLALPQQMDTAGQPLFECLQFADRSYAWGTVRLADVQIADGKALNLPVQLIGDAAAPTAPSECSLALTAKPLPAADTVAALDANGILGIGVFREDCGAGCTLPPAAGQIYQYYTCTTNACNGETLATSLQVQNPVYHFATNNNGVVIELPAIGPAGAFGARGSLVLGINTQSNNGLGTAKVLPVDALGFVTTVYNGQTLLHSYIDSASKGLYFDDAYPVCNPASVAGGLYCPGAAAPVSRSATIQGTDGSNKQVDFTIGDGLALLQAQPTYNAFGNFGGPLGDATAFDWGLPFFYGRSVFVAIEGQSTTGATGPYFAF